MNPLLEAITALAKQPAFARDVMAGIPAKAAFAGEMLQDAAKKMRWMPEDVAKFTVIRQGSSPRPMYTYGINKNSLVSDKDWAIRTNEKLASDLAAVNAPVVKVKPYFVNVQSPLWFNSPEWKALSEDASKMFPQYGGYRMAPTTSQIKRSPYDAVMLKLDEPGGVHLSSVSGNLLYRPRVIPADPELMADLFKSRLARAMMSS